MFLIHPPYRMKDSFFAAYSEACLWYTLGYAVFSVYKTTQTATPWSIM